VKYEVKDAYNAFKDFFISFTDARILEAILTYFKMKDVLSPSAEHCLPDDESLLTQWAMDNFQTLVKTFVGTFTYHAAKHINADVPVQPIAGTNFNYGYFNICGCRGAAAI